MRRPFNERRILVVGSANMDLVTRTSRCPRPGETVMGHSFETVPGGKGANQAIAAARLGAQTFFAGSVGADAFGEALRENLRQAGVDVTHLRTQPDVETGTAAITVAEDGENTIVVTPSANSAFLPSHVEELAPLFSELDVVLLQLEIPLDTVEAALDLARRHDVFSVLDAGGAAQDVPDALIQKPELVSPNETEAEALTGIRVETLEDAQEAGEALRARGAREVVLKLGSRGALYVGAESLHVPAFSVRAVDTVAAGDAFTAALALVWKAGPLEGALGFANAAGALAATVMGAQPSMPSDGAVRRFLKERGTDS